MLKVTKIEVGELQCNCYLIEKNNTYLLVDPGDEYQKILKLLIKKIRLLKRKFLNGFYKQKRRIKRIFKNLMIY